MRRSKLPLLAFLLVSLVLFACNEQASTDTHEHEPVTEEDLSSDIEVLKIENLLRDSLALAEDVEIIVSYLEVPVQTGLPKHYHPGEEFVYMLEGSGQLIVEGDTTTLGEGDLYKIPIRAVHSFHTVDEQARAVVFRVHEKGQPERVLVE
ncbi:MAG: cupin domain-containing protein [Saprospiraceae bacterium]|nr:cupin domain-containing protein [Saprospiraceae bacterium]